MARQWLIVLVAIVWTTLLDRTCGAFMKDIRGDEPLLCGPENCCDNIDTDALVFLDSERASDAVPDKYGILEDQITEPDTWPGGEAEWWMGLKEIMNKGGPGTAGYESRSTATITYLQTDRKGRKHIVNEGGGSPNVFGCTLLYITSDTGVYVSHIWEQPTFYKRRDTSDGSGQRTAWENNVHRFFRDGATHPAMPGKPNYGPFPDSPSLVSLTRPYKPFHKYGRKFLDIVIFSVSETNDPTSLKYPERIDELKKELGGILSYKKDDIRVQVYPRPPRPSSPLGFDLAIAWQLATKEPKDDEEQYCLRTFWDGELFQDDDYFQPSENEDHCSFKVVVDASDRNKLFRKKLKLDVSVYDKNAEKVYHAQTDYSVKDKKPFTIKKGSTSLDEDVVVEFRIDGDKLEFKNYHVQFKAGSAEWKYGAVKEAHPAALPRCLGGEWKGEKRESWCHFEC